MLCAEALKFVHNTLNVLCYTFFSMIKSGGLNIEVVLFMDRDFDK